MLYVFAGALMAAFCAGYCGYKNRDFDYDVLFLPVIAGLCWPITMVTFLPYLVGRRLKEVEAIEEKADAELAENMAEVDRFLAPPDADGVKKYLRSKDGKLVPITWMGGPL